MRAEDLVALASAHGIDLIAAARLGTPPVRRDTIKRGRNGHSYQVLIPPPLQPANGHATRSSVRPAWSMEELGQAAAGVPPLHFMAACYAYAGDHSSYWKLWSAIARVAQDLRVRYSWPAQVRSVGGGQMFYCERLAQLVLDEDANPALFGAVAATERHASLHAIYLEVDEHTWREKLFERFDAVKLRFLGWTAEAMRTMQPRLDELAGEESEA